MLPFFLPSDLDGYLKMAHKWRTSLLYHKMANPINEVGGGFSGELSHIDEVGKGTRISHLLRVPSTTCSIDKCVQGQK